MHQDHVQAHTAHYCAIIRSTALSRAMEWESGEASLLAHHLGQVLLVLKVCRPQFNCNYFAMASNEDTYQLLIIANCLSIVS